MNSGEAGTPELGPSDDWVSERFGIPDTADDLVSKIDDFKEEFKDFPSVLIVRLPPGALDALDRYVELTGLDRQEAFKQIVKEGLEELAKNPDAIDRYLETPDDEN